METYIGDTLTIVLDTGIDISSFQTYRIKYEKPDGTTGYWAAGLCPTNDNRLQYRASSSDLNIKGTWKLQSYVRGGSLAFHGRYAELQVLNPLS